MTARIASASLDRRRLDDATLALGWLLVLIGATGLAGVALGWEAFLRPLPAFPALSLAESLGSLALAGALVFAVSGRYQAALMVGAALATLGLFVLARHLGGAAAQAAPPAGPPGLSPLALSVSSALLLGFGGAGVAGLGLPPSTDRGRLTAGAFGAIVTVLATGILLARIIWRADVEGGLLVGSSLQLLLATLALGLCLAAGTWIRDPATVSAPWLPLSVGAASLVTVIVLWRAFVGYDRAQIRQQTQGAAQAAVQQVGRQVEAATRALGRVARFESTPWPRSRDGENRAVALTRDIDGLMAVAWVDSTTVVRQIRPAPLDTDSLRDHLSLRLGQELATAPSRGPSLPRYLPLDHGSFAIAVPHCEAGECGAYLAGILDARALLAPVLADTSGGFVTSVTSERRAVIAPPGRLAPPIDWTEPASFTVGQLRWDLAVWPSAQTLARHRSGLPDLLLLLGLFVSTLLPLTIRLSQINQARARLVERLRFQEALETATDGIWEWEVASGAARRSDVLWRHLGYDPGEMGGKPDPWPWLIHAADQPRVMKALSEHLGGQASTFDARYRIRARDGTWHWMLDRGRVVEWSPTGRPTRVMGISADITERQRADEALAASERRFRACFESAHDLQVLLDGQGRVLEANRVMVEFAGLVLSAMRGRHLWELPCWRAGDGPAAGEIAEAAIAATMGKTVRRELELAGRSGEPLLLDVTLSPIADPDGRVAQVLVDGRDVTLRRRAEQALHEVESLTTMGRIAARVAHEINNPLAGIQNAFLLIRDAVPKDHPHQRYVGAVEREITRIAAVTRQLYETYRPESQADRGTSLASLVGDAVALLEQVNRDRGVRVEVDLRDSPPRVPLPDAVLRQALYNLVQNAIEASPPGGLVEVAAAVEDDTFTMAVGDRGPGIPTELRQRVFEPFFTTKDGTLRTGGMGLGLSLVARSVQALGGRVEIHDRTGGGTLVAVRLPLHAPTGATA